MKPMNLTREDKIERLLFMERRIDELSAYINSAKNDFDIPTQLDLADVYNSLRDIADILYMHRKAIRGAE